MIFFSFADGYGEKLINLIRWQLGEKHFAGSEFPLTLGRDFSGVVTAVGKGVTGYNVGDEVCIYPTTVAGSMQHKVNFKQSTAGLSSGFSFS